MSEFWLIISSIKCVNNEKELCRYEIKNNLSISKFWKVKSLYLLALFLLY